LVELPVLTSRVGECLGQVARLGQLRHWKSVRPVMIGAWPWCHARCRSYPHMHGPCTAPLTAPACQEDASRALATMLVFPRAHSGPLPTDREESSIPLVSGQGQ
jgi:hypothetical protein